MGAVYNPLLDDMYAARRGGGTTLNGRPRRVSDVDDLSRAMLGTGFSYDLGGDEEQNNIGPFSRFLLKAQAVRRAGSAALAIAKVGVGRSDGFWERGLQPGNGRGSADVEEGGGRQQLVGPRQARPRKLVATNGRIHDEMLQCSAPFPPRPESKSPLKQPIAQSQSQRLLELPALPHVPVVSACSTSSADRIGFAAGSTCRRSTDQQIQR